MGNLLLPIGIIAVGLLIGKGLRELWEKGQIPTSVPLDKFLKRVIQWVILCVNPVIIIGAFWFVKLDSFKLTLLPLLGIFTLLLGGVLALCISKLQKLDCAKTGAMFVSGSFTNMGSFGTLFCFVFIGEESLPFIAMFRLLEEFVYYSVGFPIAKAFGKKDGVEAGKSKLLKLLADPFIFVTLLSILIGCVLNMSLWERPALYGTIISFMVPLSTLLMVIPIGFNMKMNSIRGYFKECCSISIVKFFIVPLTVTSLGYMLGIGQLHENMVLKVILILSAMPPAFTSLVPPQLYQLDSDLANSSWLFNSGMLLFITPALYFILQVM